jgi:hypothetical protein
VVSEAQGAAPRFRRHRPANRSEQRFGIAIRNGQHRNLGDGGSVGNRQALHTGLGAHPRGERIARIQRHVLHAAALHTFFRAPRAGGVRVAGEVAVLVRVGINNAAHRAVFGGHFGLDSAPRSAVARDHDGALHRDAVARQFFVVRGHSVVDVDQRRGHVAVNRVALYVGSCSDCWFEVGSSWIAGSCSLAWNLVGATSSTARFLRRGIQHVESFDLRLESIFRQASRDPFGVLLVVGRPYVVGMRGKQLHGVAHAVRRRDGAELLLPLALGARRFVGVARKRHVLRVERKPQHTEHQNTRENRETFP